MKEKEKLIITLWRGQIDNPKKFQSVFCRLNYHGQEQSSQPIPAAKSLAWKQTFVFSLSNQEQVLSLDFMNVQPNQEIHFANSQILQSMTFGKSNVTINLDNSNRGTVPAKLTISNLQHENIGIIFLEYEIIKTEVTYIVQKLLDYEFLLKLSVFRITFTRELKSIPNFYLKFKYGNKTHKEDFAFEEIDGTYIYNYPVKLYIKNQQQLNIQTQIKGKYQKDYRNLNTSFDTQSNHSNSKSIKKPANKKNQLDLGPDDELISILDLNYKKNTNIHQKLPLNIMIKNTQRQIGTLEFDVDVIFKTKKQKEEFQIQKRRQHQLKNKPFRSPVNKSRKKQKKYQPPKNGSIIINSIIGKLFNEEAIENKDISIQLALGKSIQSSSQLENPGKQLIWMDTFVFKRTWQETIKFTIHVHSEGKKLPTYYSDINIRDLFEKGRYMAKKLDLKDGENAYCGTLTIDMVYEEQEEKQKESSRKKTIPVRKSPEQIEMENKEKKRLMIMERMRKREEEKKKFLDYESALSENQLYLPPLKNKKSIVQDKRTLSPKRSVNQSVNVYNKGGVQVFSRSPRFDEYGKKESVDLFFYNPDSDFEGKKKKGTNFGYGDKYDFTRVYQQTPGIGRYEIPSVWDKYK